MLCKVTHCAGRVSANTRPHQLSWGDREMGTAIICVECSQVAGLIQKVGRDSSKSTVSSCSCPSCSCPSCSCLSFEDLAYAHMYTHIAHMHQQTGTLHTCTHMHTHPHTPTHMHTLHQTLIHTYTHVLHLGRSQNTLIKQWG